MEPVEKTEIQSFIPHAVVQSHRNGMNPRNPKPRWFTNDIRRLVRIKYRLFIKARSSAERSHWTNYCTKSAYFKQQANILADPNYSPSKWWHVAKHFCGLQGSAANDVIPLMDLSHAIPFDDPQKADLLNNTFIKQTTSLNAEKFPSGPTDVPTTFDFKGFSA